MASFTSTATTPRQARDYSLGSTSVMSNENGGKVPGTLTRFLPFGEYRPGMEPTANLTDHPAASAGPCGFTGHKHNDGLGLIYMNARFYVPGIGRFASADIIVPNPANPQHFNRYSYVSNNPLRMVDPSGHVEWDLNQGFYHPVSGYWNLIEDPPWAKLEYARVSEPPAWAHVIAAVTSLGNPELYEAHVDELLVHESDVVDAFNVLADALDGLDDIGDVAEAIHTWTKSTPGFEAIPYSWALNAASQWLRDLNEPMSVGERIMRTALVVVEGALVDFISIEYAPSAAMMCFNASLPYAVSTARPEIAAAGAVGGGVGWFLGWQLLGDYWFNKLNEHVAFPFIHKVASEFDDLIH